MTSILQLCYPFFFVPHGHLTRIPVGGFPYPQGNVDVDIDVVSDRRSVSGGLYGAMWWGCPKVSRHCQRCCSPSRSVFDHWWISMKMDSPTPVTQWVVDTLLKMSYGFSKTAALERLAHSESYPCWRFGAHYCLKLITSKVGS